MSPSCQLLVEFLQVQLDHGTQNGKLNATHRSLEQFGIPYSSIKSVIEEAVSLALIEITCVGKSGLPTRYRLIQTSQPAPGVKRARL